MNKRGYNKIIVNKGQTTVAVAVLILAMLVFILIYILSLPQEERNKLLNLTSEQESSGKVVQITIKVKEFSFDPDSFNVNKGDKVVITLKNEGKLPHNLVISEFNVRTITLKPGEEDVISFIADKKGSFTYYCSIPGHRDAGLVGTLNVK